MPDLRSPLAGTTLALLPGDLATAQQDVQRLTRALEQAEASLATLRKLGRRVAPHLRTSKQQAERPEVRDFLAELAKGGA